MQRASLLAAVRLGLWAAGTSAQTPPPIEIVIEERVRVSDLPAVVPPAIVNVQESIQVLDLQAVVPPAVIGVVESILVGHTDAVVPPLSINVLEALGVTDIVGIPNTPEGDGVSVDIEDLATGAKATVTFDHVETQGATTLSTSGSGPSPPFGFATGDPSRYYDISTTAEFTGEVEVCIDYDPVAYQDETHVGLFQYEGMTPAEITTSIDPAVTTVCGVTPSLSLFGIFEAATRPTVAVVNRNSNSVTLIDAETTSVASTLATPIRSVNAAFTDFLSGASSSKLYLAGRNEVGTLLGADPVSPETARELQPGDSLSAGLRPRAVAVSPDGATIWVADERSDILFLFDVATDAFVSLVRTTTPGFRTGEAPFAIAFSPDGTWAFVVAQDSNDLLVIDVAAARHDPENAVVTAVHVGRKPVDLAVAPAGDRVYVSTRDHVAVVDTTFPRAPVVVATVEAGERPHGMALTPSGDKLYVTDIDADRVHVFELVDAPTLLAPLASLEAGAEPTAVAALDPIAFEAIPHVYVVNTDDGTVSVIDTTRDIVVATVPVGRRPFAVATGALPALTPR